MRADASKLLIIFVQLLFSGTLLNFSVDHLWLLSPGKLPFKLLTAIRDNERRTFGFTWNLSSPPAMISAQFPIVVVCQDWCTLNRAVHRSFKWGSAHQTSKCAKTFKSSDLQRNQMSWMWSFFRFDKFSTRRLRDNGVFVFVNIDCDWGERCSVWWKIFVHLIGS